jgi:4-hydroxy-tetrahydrodipicolinate synthase
MVDLPRPDRTRGPVRIVLATAAPPLGAPITSPAFEGVGVALATLFADDDRVDFAATAAHAARLVDLGVSAVIVAGTTGEVDALSDDERLTLLREVQAAVGDRVPVVVGTAHASSRDTRLLTAAAAELKPAAMLVRSPPRVADPRAFYRDAANAAGDVAVLAYHFPAVSPPGIALDLLADLPIAGCKDSSGDPTRLLASLDAFDRPLYVGSAALLSLAGGVGVTGAILALANVQPELCMAAFAGDGEAQRALVPAHLASTRDFPHGLKEVMAERFATSTRSRLG